MSDKDALDAVAIRIEGLTRLELKALQGELGAAAAEGQSRTVASGQGSFAEFCANVVVSGASAASAIYAVKKTVDATTALVISVKKLRDAIQSKVVGSVEITALPVDSDYNDESSQSVTVCYDPSDENSEEILHNFLGHPD